MLKLVESMTYHPTYSFAIIGRSEQSLQTMARQLLENETWWFTMAQPVPVKAVALGRKPEKMLMLKIHVLSSGAATVVKRMLLLTNFEEVLTSVTSFAGLTGILSLWKPKELPVRYVQRIFGLRATCIRSRGIPSLTSRRRVHYCDACKLWRSHEIYRGDYENDEEMSCSHDGLHNRECIVKTD